MASTATHDDKANPPQGPPEKVEGWSCHDSSYHSSIDQRLRPHLTQTKDHWKTVSEYFREKEEARCKVWREEVNNVLIFSGLFSAVVSALLVESYKDIKEDPNQVLLNSIAVGVARLANITDSDAGIPKTSSPPLSSFVINSLWFLSLIFSLATAIISIVALQWLREHLRAPAEDVNPSYLPALLQMQSESLDRFGVPQIFNILPLLLLTGLILFLIGMISFLYSLNSWVATPSWIAIASVFGFLFITTFYPGSQSLPQAPYISRGFGDPIAGLETRPRDRNTGATQDSGINSPSQLPQSEGTDNSSESHDSSTTASSPAAGGILLQQSQANTWLPCPYKSPQSQLMLRSRIILQSWWQTLRWKLSHGSGSGFPNSLNLSQFGLRDNWSHFTIMCLHQREWNQRSKLLNNPKERLDTEFYTPLYDCVMALLRAKRGFLKSANHKILDVHMCINDIVEEATNRGTETQLYLYNLVPVGPSAPGFPCIKFHNFDLKAIKSRLEPTMDSVQLFFAQYGISESVEPMQTTLPSHLHVEACIRVSNWMIHNLTRPAVTPPAFPAILLTDEVIQGISEPEFKMTLSRQLLRSLELFVDSATYFWSKFEQSLKSSSYIHEFCAILAHAFEEHPHIKKHLKKIASVTEEDIDDDLLLCFNKVAQIYHQSDLQPEEPEARGPGDGFIFYLASFRQDNKQQQELLKSFPGLLGISPYIGGFLQNIANIEWSGQGNLAYWHTKILDEMSSKLQAGDEERGREYLYVVAQLHAARMRQLLGETTKDNDSDISPSLRQLEDTLDNFKNKNSPRTKAIKILLDPTTTVRIGSSRSSVSEEEHPQNLTDLLKYLERLGQEEGFDNVQSRGVSVN